MLIAGNIAGDLLYGILRRRPMSPLARDTLQTVPKATMDWAHGPVE